MLREKFTLVVSTAVQWPVKQLVLTPWGCSQTCATPKPPPQSISVRQLCASQWQCIMWTWVSSKLIKLVNSSPLSRRIPARCLVIHIDIMLHLCKPQRNNCLNVSKWLPHLLLMWSPKKHAAATNSQVLILNENSWGHCGDKSRYLNRDPVGWCDEDEDVAQWYWYRWKWREWKWP